MNAAPVFYGTVSAEAAFVPHDKAGLRKWLLTLTGKRAQLVITKEKNARSAKQNAYYWAVPVQMLSDETGFLPEEAHEFFKSKFLKTGVDFKGQRYEITRSTTALSTIEFEDYMEHCRQFVAEEFGIVVPLPGEVHIEMPEQ